MSQIDAWLFEKLDKIKNHFYLFCYIDSFKPEEFNRTFDPYRQANLNLVRFKLTCSGGTTISILTVQGFAKRGIDRDRGSGRARIS